MLAGSRAIHASSSTPRTPARQTVGIAQIVRETSLTRQTVYRIEDDPVGPEAALAAWEL